MENEEEVARRQKMNRLAVGATVASVLLIVFFLILLIVGFVQIGVRVHERNELDRQIEEYRGIVEKNELELDDYLTGDGLYYRALLQGWRTPENR